MTAAADGRVKAAAPSCGGISDRHNKSPLFRATLGDDVSLKKISCTIAFLSPANDFHGRIGDLPKAIAEINADQWRVTCSPHHNHQDTPRYEVATMLWMDQYLRGSFSFPQTPETTLAMKTDDGVPSFRSTSFTRSMVRRTKGQKICRTPCIVSGIMPKPKEPAVFGRPGCP
jgi:hypothetical protein